MIIFTFIGAIISLNVILKVIDYLCGHYEEMDDNMGMTWVPYSYKN